MICGPTAAGKSAVALWLAGQTPTTIVSADSRQVYRGFDIGTAKPTSDERARVPHVGLDVADPAERYSAARWADQADDWIRQARDVGRVPVVVGGTGLYLRALFDGLFQEPRLDAERRSALGVELGTMETEVLRRWVTTLDPARAHLGRTQLLRAAEIALLTGRRLSDLHRERRRPARWQPHYLLVDPGAAVATRIASRIDDMLDRGWIEEVTRLVESIPAGAPAWNATGYDAVRRLAAGTTSRVAAHEEILIATRQYAKRQRTWFRHQLPADQVTLLDPAAGDWRSVVARWHTGIPMSTSPDAETNA